MLDVGAVRLASKLANQAMDVVVVNIAWDVGTSRPLTLVIVAVRQARKLAYSLVSVVVVKQNGGDAVSTPNG